MTRFFRLTLLSWVLPMAASLLGSRAHGQAVASTKTPLSPPPSWEGSTISGERLQECLDRGDDVVLEPGKIYELRKPLFFKKAGQKLSSRNAANLRDYAVLRISDPACGNLINAFGIPGVKIERVILDGNRYRMGVCEEKAPALVYIGGFKASGQRISHCVLMSGRSWSLLHIFEGAKETTVESNLFLGSGVDARGNGREGRERKLSWNDAISCAAEKTIIRDNLIMDATDGAIVLFAAPGTIVEDNVLAAVSRESLGAINLVDSISAFAIDGDKDRTSYRGTVVRNNLIDSAGARIHIAVPMGGWIWGPANGSHVLVGGEVTGNLLLGRAAGYGFAANGIDEFTIAGNRSTALCSGTGDGLSPTARPDASQPFLYAGKGVGKSLLQPEFKKAEKPLIHLLRCNHGPLNAMGYRTYEYSDAEARAAVETAFVEMLGRDPKSAELEHFTRWLQETRSNIDQVRIALMMTPEFRALNGSIAPEDMQHFRLRLWLATFDKLKSDAAGGPDSLSARELYREAWNALRRPRHPGNAPVPGVGRGVPPRRTSGVGALTALSPPSESGRWKAIRWPKVRARGTPAPARETHALPGVPRFERSHTLLLCVRYNVSIQKRRI